MSQVPTVKEIVTNLYYYFKHTECIAPIDTSSNSEEKALTLTAKATGVSTSDVRKCILLNRNESNFDNIAIIMRTAILDAHLNCRSMCVLSKLFDEVKCQCQPLKVTDDDLHKALKKLDFISFNNYVIEKCSARLKRLNILKSLANDTKTIYLFVMVLGIDGMTKRSISIFKNMSNRKPILIAHAAGAAGYLKNTLQVTELIDDTNLEKNNIFYKHCRKWLLTQLMPDLPIGATLVCDKETLNNLIGESPRWYSKKSFMLSWLKKHNIEVQDDLSKPEIYEVIKEYKSTYLEAEYGLKCIKLPEYLPNLYPYDTIWNLLPECDSIPKIKIEFTNNISKSWFDAVVHSKHFLNKLIAEYQLDSNW